MRETAEEEGRGIWKVAEWAREGMWEIAEADGWEMQYAKEEKEEEVDEDKYLTETTENWIQK